MINRNTYVVEQLSSLPAVISQIREFRPHVVFTSEANLDFQLHALRKKIGIPYKLLFSNGGPCHPPFDRTDFVHQVAPLYLEEALAAGEHPQKHIMVPYGINLTDPPVEDPEAKRTMRHKLGLPLDRKIILSVGWIAKQHKRMDYVIREVARLPEPRPFLQLLGAIDEASPEILALGTSLLGSFNFSAKSVPYEDVSDYYKSADCFVLGSLKEGFGRVYLEALMHGLPTIAHRFPVMEYVMGDVGILADLEREGELSEILTKQMKTPSGETSAYKRWQSIKDRFSWQALAPAYAEMFGQVARSSP